MVHGAFEMEGAEPTAKRQKLAALKVHVSFPDGSTCEIQVPSDSTVLQLKYRIAVATGRTVAGLYVPSDESTLDDDSLAASACDSSGAAALIATEQSSTSLTASQCVGESCTNEQLGELLALMAVENLDISECKQLTLLDLNLLAQLTVLDMSDSRAICTKLLSPPAQFLCQLRSLSLRNNKIGATIGVQLATVLGETKMLTLLDISGNDLKADGGKALAKGLRKNKTLTCLRIGDNGLGVGGFAPVAKALKTIAVFAELDVSANDLRLGAAKEISSAFKASATLTSINISSNSFGPDSIPVFADMFQTNNSIVKLTFTGDIVKKERYTPRFGPEHSVTMDTSQTEMSFIGKKLYAWGTSLISAFIPKCPQLTRLILSSNVMTGGTADNIAGISDLCDRLSTNTSLLHVSVSNNYLRLAAVKQLARMVTKNTTMTSLNMYGNQIQIDEFAHNPYNILTDKPAWLTSQ